MFKNFITSIRENNYRENVIETIKMYFKKKIYEKTIQNQD